MKRFATARENECAFRCARVVVLFFGILVALAAVLFPSRTSGGEGEDAQKIKYEFNFQGKGSLVVLVPREVGHMCNRFGAQTKIAARARGKDISKNEFVEEVTRQASENADSIIPPLTRMDVRVAMAAIDFAYDHAHKGVPEEHMEERAVLWCVIGGYKSFLEKKEKEKEIRM